MAGSIRQRIDRMVKINGLFFMLPILALLKNFSMASIGEKYMISFSAKMNLQQLEVTCQVNEADIIQPFLWTSRTLQINM